MTWSIFALLAAFFDTAYYGLIKKSLQSINQYVLSAGVFLISSAVLFAASFLKGLPEIGPVFYSAVLVTGSLNVIGAVLYFTALKTTDLSLAVPMISFTPVFLIGTSFFLLGEFPTIFGAGGIFLIAAGSYVLNTSKNSTKLSDPIKSMITNRGTLCMLAAAFIFSISSNFDKLAVQNSDPIFSSAVILLFLGVCFLCVSLAKAKTDLICSRKHIKTFLPPAIMLSLSAVAVNIALTMQIVPYVISLKRISILFSVVYGGYLFKEKNMFRRIAGAVTMLGGIILIMLL